MYTPGGQTRTDWMHKDGQGGERSEGSKRSSKENAITLSLIASLFVLVLLYCLIVEGHFKGQGTGRRGDNPETRQQQADAHLRRVDHHRIPPTFACYFPLESAIPYFCDCLSAYRKARRFRPCCLPVCSSALLPNASLHHPRFLESPPPAPRTWLHDHDRKGFRRRGRYGYQLSLPASHDHHWPAAQPVRRDRRPSS